MFPFARAFGRLLVIHVPAGLILAGTVVGPGNPPASTVAHRITPPATWRAAYYDLMRQLGRDTVPSGFLKLRPPAPKFEELEFDVADSLPGHLAFDLDDRTPLLGLAEPALRRLSFRTNEVERDSVPAWLVLHEMAHVITHCLDHPGNVFNPTLGTTWNGAENNLAGLIPSAAVVAMSP